MTSTPPDEQLIAEQAASAKPSIYKQILKQVFGIGLAALFLWLSFKDANLSQLWLEMQKLNPFWLVMVCVSGMISHVLRAVRWIIMMQPLKEERISLWNAFCALMYGYAINVVIPRGGEIARLVAIARSEKLPWAGVLPTVFIDRLLDVAMLVLMLGVTLVALPPQIKSDMPMLVPVGIGMCVATVIGLFVLPFFGKILRRIVESSFAREKLPEKTVAKIVELSAQFEVGTRSLTNPIGFPIIAFLSVAIFFCYWLNFYFMFWAFGLEKRVDIPHSLIVFAIGSIGVLVPTPGSIGPYHYSVSKSLEGASGIEPSLALAYATVLHFFCFIVLTCVPAAICFVVESIRKSK